MPGSLNTRVFLWVLCNENGTTSTSGYAESSHQFNYFWDKNWKVFEIFLLNISILEIIYCCDFPNTKDVLFRRIQMHMITFKNTHRTERRVFWFVYKKMFFLLYSVFLLFFRLYFSNFLIPLTTGCSIKFYKSYGRCKL